MRVSFASRRLRRRYESHRDAERAWGVVVGRRYVRRVNELLAAPSFEALYEIRSMRLHALTGTWAGRFAISLTGQVRLIVELDENDAVIVREVVDYHG
jgi:proteic killer suppression protein